MEYRDSICESEKPCFFDSHAHYYDDRFYGEENPEGAEALLDELFQNGVCGIVNIGTCAKTSALCIEQAKKFEKMYVAAGIHPEDIEGSPLGLEGELSALRAMLEKREENKIVALGEIGLDYHWDTTFKEQQQEALREQMRWAEQYDLPVMIHSRDATEDTLKILREFPNVKGVMHCFSGSHEVAEQVVKMGYYLGIGGVITFKNCKLAEHLVGIPLERLVLETDAPYMAPVPYRGKRNESRWMWYVAERLAQVYNCSPEYINEVTTANAKELFVINL